MKIKWINVNLSTKSWLIIYCYCKVTYRIEKGLKTKSFKILNFGIVCMCVWAWGRGRGHKKRESKISEEGETRGKFRWFFSFKIQWDTEELQNEFKILHLRNLSKLFNKNLSYIWIKCERINQMLSLQLSLF